MVDLVLCCCKVCVIGVCLSDGRGSDSEFGGGGVEGN